MTINLIDARRGLYDKCLELFADKNIAEKIYRYLCDGIEDCEEAEPKKGRWIFTRYYVWECSECGKNPTRGMGYTQGKSELFRYCPHCGAKMEVTE